MFVRAPRSPFCRLLATLAGSLVLASCGTIQTEAEAPPPSSLAFVPDDADVELRWALVRADSYDPQGVSLVDQDAVIVSDLLYDGLTEIGPGASLRPALATNWESSDDAMVWTFMLDTERILASEVVESIDRLRTQHPESPAALLLADLATVEAIGDGQVRLEMTRPTAGLAWILSGLPYSVVPGDGEPTGHYRFEGSDPVSPDSGANQSVLETADGGEAVTVTWTEGSAESARLLEAGDVNGAVIDDLDADASQTAIGDASALSVTRFYVLHPRSDALADVRMRAAVIAATNPVGLAPVLAAHGFPADGLVAPTMAGFLPEACDEVCRHDPAVAQTLIEQFGPLPTLRVGYAGADQAVLADALAGQLEAAGFTVEVEYFDPEGLNQGVADGSVDLFAFGWIAPAGSIDAVVPPLMGAGSPVNVFGEIDPRIQGLLDEAGATVEPVARWSILNEAQRLALQQAVAIPVSSARSGFVHDARTTPLAVRADGSVLLDG